MITLQCIHELKNAGGRWNQAIIRTYSIDVLLTDDGVSWLNSDSRITFKIVKRESNTDEGGVYTLLNVYVEREEDFEIALTLLEMLEKRIAEVMALIEACKFFGVDEMLRPAVWPYSEVMIIIEACKFFANGIDELTEKKRQS